MYYFNADARDGGASNLSACNTCCCAPLYLHPGETGSVQINYAPWVLPIAPPGLIPGGTEYIVELNDAGCANNAVCGFLPPTNTNYELTVALNTPLTIDVSLNAAPVGNNFLYSLVPLTGPYKGSIAQPVAGGAEFVYTPVNGFTGYDYFSYKMTDPQGREIVRSVRVSVGTHNQLPDIGRMSLVPYIDMSGAKVNQHMMTLTFPVTMPISCRPCEYYRLTIQQNARDCEGNTYKHQMCFDLSCKNCG